MCLGCNREAIDLWNKLVPFLENECEKYFRNQKLWAMLKIR